MPYRFEIFFLLLLAVFALFQEDVIKLLKKNQIPFRIGRLNDIWTRALKLLKDERQLLDFYGDLSLQDSQFIKLKHGRSPASSDQEDEINHDESHKSHLDVKLLEILLKYNLNDIYLDELERLNADKNDNKVDIISDNILGQSLSKNSKFLDLWLKAQVGNFSGDELATIREQFQQYANKLSEYEELVVRIEEEEKRMEEEERQRNSSTKRSLGASNATSNRTKDMLRRLKVVYREMNETIASLANKINDRLKTEKFSDYRLSALWKFASKLNLTREEADDLKREFTELMKKIDKHDYYFKEAEKLKVLSRARSQLEKINKKVEAHAKKIKSWYQTLKSKLYGRINHTEL